MVPDELHFWLLLSAVLRDAVYRDGGDAGNRWAWDKAWLYGRGASEVGIRVRI